MPSQISEAALGLAQGKIRYSLWDEWNARGYLNTYFKKLGQDSIENLKFLVRELSRLKDKPKQAILDFGSGPTIFTGLVAAPYATEIIAADYLQSNLLEIEKWSNKKSDAFSWEEFTKYILKLESNAVTDLNVKSRFADLRKKIKLVRCDASLELPLISSARQFSLVISNFCADSATSSKEVWSAYMKNIFNLVAPSGIVLLAALRNCSYYKNGKRFFPCANINENDLSEVLVNNNFSEKNCVIEVCSVPSCEPEGFTSVMFVKATKLDEKQIQVKKTFLQTNILNQKLIKIQ